MISPGALEDAVLALLCFSEEHSTLLALRVPVDLFSNRTNSQIAKVTLDHIERYHGPPKGQLEYLLESEMMRGEAGKLLGNQIDSLTAQFKEIQPEFILQELDTWLDIQRMTKAATSALESLQQGDVVQARSAIARATSATEMQASPGIHLSDPAQSLAFLDRDDEEGFATGIDVIDRLRSTPARKTLSFFMASAGRGKSWALIECGSQAAMHGLKVIHVTLENSEEMTAQRYIQRWFSLGKRDGQDFKRLYFNHPPGQYTSIDLARPGLPKVRAEVARKLKRLGKRLPVYIKEFPTDSLTIEELSLFLDAFERMPGGYRADVLIVDYADLMATDADNFRISTGKLFKGLRGIAVQRNLACITASQSNREGDDAKEIKRKNVAEDWSKFGTADNAYIYSQTPAEHKKGLARISVAKSRSEVDQYTVLISQAYAIGQFCLDSVFLSGDMAEELKRVMENPNS